MIHEGWDDGQPASPLDVPSLVQGAAHARQLSKSLEE